MAEFDEFIQARISGARPEMAWSPGRGDAWRQAARTRLRTCLGGFGDPPPPPEVRRNGERIHFNTRFGLSASGYFFESGSPRPAVLCLPGHGTGVDAIVGRSHEPYQADFALQARDRGYGVLALEPLGFGARKSSRSGPHGWSCEADARAALMLGESLLGWRVWDAMRSVDVLQSLPNVDPDRIAIMGISGGATVALWTAALDERIAAAVLSGGFSTFRDSILAIDHCLDNFVPGVLRILDMPDLAALIAPRALFAENGNEDPIFPMLGFEAAVARAQAIYRDAGCPTQFAFESFVGGHEFRGQEAFKFLERVFKT